MGEEHGLAEPTPLRPSRPSSGFAGFAAFAAFVAFAAGRFAAVRFEIAPLVAFFADRFAFMTVSACVDVP